MSATNKIDCHDITKILLKVASNKHKNKTVHLNAGPRPASNMYFGQSTDLLMGNQITVEYSCHLNK